MAVSKKPHIICNFRYRFTQYYKGKLPIGAKIIETKKAFEYYDRDEACDKTDEVAKTFSEKSDSSGSNKDLINTEDAFNYYSYRRGSSGSWNDKGSVSPDKEQELADFYQPPVLYQMVISFDDQFACEHGLKPKKEIMSLINTSIPLAFKNMGFDMDNVVWSASYHVNTDNPHVHIRFYEKIRSRKRYNLTKSEINFFRSKLYGTMRLNVGLFKKVDNFRDTLLDTLKQLDVKSELLERFEATGNNHKNKNIPSSLINKIINLEKSLPRQGSMKFNSKNMAPYRNEILEIVHMLFQCDYVKDFYDKYLNVIDEEIEAFSKMYGEGVEEYYNKKLDKMVKGVGAGLNSQQRYKLHKIDDLESRVANMLLQNIKCFRMDMEREGISSDSFNDAEPFCFSCDIKLFESKDGDFCIFRIPHSTNDFIYVPDKFISWHKDRSGNLKTAYIEIPVGDTIKCKKGNKRVFLAAKDLKKHFKSIISSNKKKDSKDSSQKTYVFIIHKHPRPQYRIYSGYNFYRQYYHSNIKDRTNILMHGTINEIVKAVNSSFYQKLEADEQIHNAMDVARKENMNRYQ